MQTLTTRVSCAHASQQRARGHLLLLLLLLLLLRPPGFVAARQLPTDTRRRMAGDGSC
jgi:MYXO-CTERM domain-containing protein